MKQKIKSVVILSAIVIALSGCAPRVPTAVEHTEEPYAATSATKSATKQAPQQYYEVLDPLQEREEFMKAQRLPLDGTPLTAQTEEQKEYIRTQREHVLTNGGEWSKQDETFALALAADACETAILSSHDVNADKVETHIHTSPLFQSLAPEGMNNLPNNAAIMGGASIMIYGMYYMCPADYAQWQNAFEELFKP
jgi:hypothetical protein